MNTRIGGLISEDGKPMNGYEMKYDNKYAANMPMQLLVRNPKAYAVVMTNLLEDAKLDQILIC